MRTIVVTACLAIQAGLALWVSGDERLPTPPSLQHFPSSLGVWTRISEDHIGAATAAQLRANELMSWNYTETRTGAMANWFVAWFQTQRGGAQPHSPKVCLPGSGWLPDTADEMSISTTDGAIMANRYIVSRNGVRAVVVYWFETPRRAIASEWAAKFWLVADAVRDHRTDTALARIVVFENGQSDAFATAEASNFAEQDFPALRRLLIN